MQKIDIGMTLLYALHVVLSLLGKGLVTYWKSRLALADSLLVALYLAFKIYIYFVGFSVYAFPVANTQYLKLAQSTRIVVLFYRQSYLLHLRVLTRSLFRATGSSAHAFALYLLSFAACALVGRELFAYRVTARLGFEDAQGALQSASVLFHSQDWVEMMVQYWRSREGSDPLVYFSVWGLLAQFFAFRFLAAVFCYEFAVAYDSYQEKAELGQVMHFAGGAHARQPLKARLFDKFKNQIDKRSSPRKGADEFAEDEDGAGKQRARQDVIELSGTDSSLSDDLEKGGILQGRRRDNFITFSEPSNQSLIDEQQHLQNFELVEVVVEPPPISHLKSEDSFTFEENRAQRKKRLRFIKNDLQSERPAGAKQSAIDLKQESDMRQESDMKQSFI